MSAPERSRWKHFRASLSRQSRGRSKDTIAIVLLALAGVAMTLFIFTQQKASLPSWAPFVGEEFVHITGEFETAQAVAPGQGQAVDIAGIQIGKITSVALEDGHAVVGMDIEPKYMKLIHPDATLLMRPKTNLNDMVVEVTPGTAPGHLEEGDNIPLAQTESNTNLDAFLATLDADTRQYIQLLLAGGAEGIGDRGRQLSGAFRRFQPFVHYLADINKAVAARRQALAGVIHNFGVLTTELGRRNAEIERFVSGSQAALGNFANEQQAIQESLVEFPATLAAVQAGLGSSNAFSLAARPALIGLIPQAQALGPALEGDRALLRPDDGADPRPDPALHPPGAPRPHPHQAGRRAAREDCRRLRQQRSARSTRSSTSSPSNRRTGRASSSTCPGSTTTPTPPTTSPTAAARCSAAW